MFGNIVNNQRFLDLVRQHQIVVEPFDPNLVKSIHYPLYAEKLLSFDGETAEKKPKFSVAHDFTVDSTDFKIDTGKYVLASIREYVFLERGLVGQFVPSSDLIDRGLIFSSGRVEYPFGKSQSQRQKLQFGIFNASGRPLELRQKMVIAWLYIIDLNGLNNKEIPLSDEDLDRIARKILRRNRAEDDGPFYGE